MKIIVSILVFLALAMLAPACGGDQSPSGSGGRRQAVQQQPAEENVRFNEAAFNEQRFN